MNQFRQVIDLEYVIKYNSNASCIFPVTSSLSPSFPTLYHIIHLKSGCKLLLQSTLRKVLLALMVVTLCFDPCYVHKWKLTTINLCVITWGGGEGGASYNGLYGETLRMLERGYPFQARGIELIVGILTT